MIENLPEVVGTALSEADFILSQLVLFTLSFQTCQNLK